jgi:hypothetical protein
MTRPECFKSEVELYEIGPTNTPIPNRILQNRHNFAITLLTAA